MSAIAITCRICAAEFQIQSGAAVASCPACGTAHSRPKSQGASLEALRRANAERAACDFTNAGKDYHSVLRQYPDEHEALWGLVLCKYGVHYVQDERTKKRMPTLYFLHTKPITEDRDFLLACENAPEDVRASYEADAKYVAEVQRRYLGMVNADEQHYDIFLCYKGSKRGNPDEFAVEHHHASELYHKLREEYNVFFAHDTLQGVAGANYEAHIFYALQSAKVMLVVCSDPENLMTSWVHSEWSRYLERVDNREEAQIIPLLYDGCNPYALPSAFESRGIQGLRMGALTSLENLRQNLSRHLQPKAAPAPRVQGNPAGAELMGIEYAMETGNWARAVEQAQALVSRNGTICMAYLYLLLANRRIYPEDKLRTQTDPFEQTTEWKFALRAATPKEKKWLEGILNDSLALRRKLEEERQEKLRREEEARQEKLRREEEKRQEMIRQEQARWDNHLAAFADAVKKEDWKAAKEKARDMISQRPQSHLGYLNRLLAIMGKPSLEALEDCEGQFELQPDWKKAFQNADEPAKAQMKQTLEKALALRRKKAEQARIEKEKRLEAERLEKERQEAERRRQEEERRRQEAERQRKEQAQWKSHQDGFSEAARKGDWDKAGEHAQAMIAQRPQSGEGYFNALLVEYRRPTLKDLAECDELFEKSENWFQAFRRSDSETNTEMSMTLDMARARRLRLEEEKKRREEEERRAEEKRIQDEKRADAARLLKQKKWAEAEKVAEGITNRADASMVRLMAKRELTDEKAFDHAPVEVFSDPLWGTMMDHMPAERSKVFNDRRRTAEAFARSAETRRRNILSVVVAVLTLLPCYALVFGQQLLPQFTGGIAMAIPVVGFGLYAITWWSENRDGAVMLSVFTGLMAAGVAAVCLLTLWPVWAYLIIALVLSVIVFICAFWLEDGFVFMGLPMMWLVLINALGLLNVFFDYAWIDVTLNILGYWAPPAMALLDSILVQVKGLDCDSLKEWEGVLLGGSFFVALPYAMVIAMDMAPAMAGMIAMGVALLLMVLIACFCEGGYGSGIVAFLLVVIGVCGAIFLHLPQWGIVIAALVAAVVALVYAVCALDAGPSTVFSLILLWLVVLLSFTLADAFCEAAWIDTALTVTGYWCAGPMMALALILSILEADLQSLFRFVVLGVLGLVGAVLVLALGLALLGLVLGLLALPTYGVTLVGPLLLPEYPGALLLIPAVLSFILYGVAYANDKWRGGGLMTFLSLVLIAAAVCVVFIFDLGQDICTYAALGVSVVTFLLSLRTLDEYGMLCIPLSAFTALLSGSRVLAMFVQAPWVTIVGNIMTYWLPGLVTLIYVIYIIWAIGDDQCWW